MARSIRKLQDMRDPALVWRLAGSGGVGGRALTLEQVIAEALA